MLVQPSSVWWDGARQRRTIALELLALQSSLRQVSEQMDADRASAHMRMERLERVVREIVTAQPRAPSGARRGSGLTGGDARTPVPPPKKKKNRTLRSP